MKEVQVDLFNGNGRAVGEVANLLMGNGQLNVGKMRPFIGRDGRAYITVFTGGDTKAISSYKTFPIQTNATLRRDEWKQLDDALIVASRDRLGGIDDLIKNGLTYNLGNAMGTTVLEWHDVNDAFEAEVTMDGVTKSRGDRPNFQFNYIPIPIIHVDYEINMRALSASRSLGNPLDTTSAEMAARRINEKLEDMLFTDTSYSFGEKDDRSRNTNYSYINYPDRNIVALSGAWSNFGSGVTGADIIEDVLDLKQASINAKHYGPSWMLYIPTTFETVLDNDYDTSTPGTTIRERILKIAGIKGIKIVDTLPTGNILLVQMTSDTVRLIRGMGLQNVEWNTEGNMITKYKVMTIQVPQIRSDQNGKCGVTHGAFTS
jgi:hypothetical protein